MDRWPHQIRAFNETTQAIDSGERHICVTAPTGAGKSLIICDLLEWAQSRGWPAILYTNRKLLTEQMIRTLSANRIPFGVRAADFKEYENLDAPIQISSLQTEDARVLKSLKWLLHSAKLAIVDEAHLQKGATAKELFGKHDHADAARVGFSATPIGIADIYPDRLVVAGTNSELRKCGALVMCETFAPSEFDTKQLKKTKTGEFMLGDIRKHIWSPTIYGHVYDHWKKLNPDARPALLFAPGVPEALGFAKEYESRGVPAASIDSNDVYVDGKAYDSDRSARDDVLARLKAGEIKVLCNRFVLREGIDIPELYHGILATPIGSVVSYVQTVGRILRAHPTTPTVIITDHGGNWHRHGSPNADRDWSEVYDLPEKKIVERRIEKLRNKQEPEPIHCPKCSAIRKSGAECYKCGFRHEKQTRLVIQKDGKLRKVTGDIYKERKIKEQPDTAKLWERMYWACKKTGRTFKQARGYFYHRHHYWPPDTLPLMPKDPLDWDLKVCDVPFERLIPKPRQYEQQQSFQMGAT